MSCCKSHFSTKRLHSPRFFLLVCLCVKLMSHKRKWFTAQQPSASTVRRAPLIRQTPLALLPFSVHVCVHLRVLTCCTQCKHRQTAWWRSTTHMCLYPSVEHTHTRARIRTRRWSFALVRRRARAGYAVHNLCAVTWISLAGVRAAVRAHASTEHAAGKPSSQRVRLNGRRRTAVKQRTQSAQIKANSTCLIWPVFLL